MTPNETFLTIRQDIIRLYKQYEVAIAPIIKFITIFMTIVLLNYQTNHAGILSKPIVILVISLVGTLLPDRGLILSAIVLCTINALTLNILFAALVFGFLCVLYLAFMRLFPKESLLIIATVILLKLGMAYMLPILAALFGGPVCIVAIIIGIFLWQITPQIAVLFTKEVGQSINTIDFTKNFNSLLFDNILSNKSMLCFMVIFFIVFCIVYIIRKQSIDHAPYIAIIVGAVINVAGFGIAMLFLNIGINLIAVLLMTLLSVTIAAIAQFFSIVLDYSRAEVVQFEDDENYYNVKVIPKINIMSYNNKVKHIYYNDNNKNDYY